jgi:hypothetical protein
MASTIDPTLDGDMIADGRVVKKSELEQQFDAAVADIDALQGVSLTAGSGILGIAETFATRTVVTAGGLVHTQILVDLTGLNSNADGDIIGDDAAANCHLGQYTVAVMGTLVGGQVSCLQTPATGEPNIDLFSADESSGVEDTAISALTNQIELMTSGADWTTALRRGMALLPTANQYLYLVGGDGATDNTYTAGKLLIEFWGTP